MTRTIKKESTESIKKKAATDLTVIFPPLWYYLHIPTELVAVTTYVRSHGLQVEPIDLNVEAIDYFLSARTLQQITDRLSTEWATLNSRTSEAVSDQSRIITLSQVLPLAKKLVASVDDAKGNFRDAQRFYDLDQHRLATQILNKCWRLISTAHAPTEIDFYRFKTAYNEQSLADCLAAANDPSQNPYVSYFQEQVLPSLIEAESLCIALIYVHPDQIIPLITLVSKLREAGCRAHITILGSLEDQVSFSRFLHTPYHPDYELLFELIDSVIIYEAEQALLELVRALKYGASLEQVPNLVWWQDGQCVFPKKVEVMELDDLPTPDYHGLPLEKYLFPEPVFALLSSRGCYWDRCTFCAITSNQLRYKAQSFSHVIRDLTRLQATYGVRWFHFRDMLMSPAFLRRFSTAILEAGLDVRWICRARFESAFTREILHLMVQAGCVQVWFGFETANQRVLNRMEKGTDVSVISRILNDCNSVGLGVHMLTMYGFPSELRVDAEETVAFLEEKSAQIDSCSYTNFILFKGTPVAQDPKKFGLKIPDEQHSLLQYKLEYLSPRDREQKNQTFQRLDQRLKQAIPMPLLHVSYTSLYREYFGDKVWRLAGDTNLISDTQNLQSMDVPLDQLSFRWSHPTYWLKSLADTRKASPSNDEECRNFGSVILAQIEKNTQVHLDGRVSSILKYFEELTYHQLVELLVQQSNMNLRSAQKIINDSIRALLDTGFVVKN